MTVLPSPPVRRRLAVLASTVAAAALVAVAVPDRHDEPDPPAMGDRVRCAIDPADC